MLVRLSRTCVHMRTFDVSESVKGIFVFNGHVATLFVLDDNTFIGIERQKRKKKKKTEKKKRNEKEKMLSECTH